MQQGDVQGRVCQGVETTGGDAAKECAALAGICIRKAVLFPDRTPVEQRPVGDPFVCAIRGMVKPGLPLIQAIVPQVAHPTRICLRSLQRGNLDAQPPGRDPVVVVPVGDQRSPAPLAGQVALGAHREPCAQAQVAYAIVVWDEVGNGV